MQLLPRPVGRSPHPGFVPRFRVAPDDGGDVARRRRGARATASTLPDAAAWSPLFSLTRHHPGAAERCGSCHAEHPGVEEVPAFHSRNRGGRSGVVAGFGARRRRKALGNVGVHRFPRVSREFGGSPCSVSARTLSRVAVSRYITVSRLESQSSLGVSSEPVTVSIWVGTAFLPLAPADFVPKVRTLARRGRRPRTDVTLTWGGASPDYNPSPVLIRMCPSSEVTRKTARP